MAIKMRVLYASNKGKIAEMAGAVGTAYDLPVNAVDKIPPAYSCNNERVVILMFSLKGEPEDQVRLFCEEMTRARAQNVAIVMDGPEAAAQRMKEILTKAGTNVFDEIHFVKTAKLAFLDKFKPEEKDELLAFVERVVANLQ